MRITTIYIIIIFVFIIFLIAITMTITIQLGARIKMSKANDFYPGTNERVCLVTGDKEAVTEVTHSSLIIVMVMIMVMMIMWMTMSGTNERVCLVTGTRRPSLR